MKIKVTYIIANIDRAIGFEWVALYLDKEKFDLSFILLHAESPFFFDFLQQNKTPVTFIKYSGKKDMPGALRKTIGILRKLKPDVVHCHLFDANLIGLTAAKLLGIKKRIYTRHHSTFHHQYHPHMVKWDRYCNRVATHIVSISKVVTQCLVEKEQVPPGKIIKVPHGFDLESFGRIDEKIVPALKEKYNRGNPYPVIGVISRFVEWKGVQYIIPAFKQLVKDHPGARLLLFNAAGNFEPHLDKLLAELPPGSYHKIVFESEVTSLYRLFTLFVHAPIDSHSEAFGQIYVEALASGIPSVFTRSGIANEFIVNKKNALVVPYKDPQAIYKALSLLLKDEALAREISEQGKKDVSDEFTVRKMVLSLEILYAGK